ncbi:hypothetical protein MHM93_18785 [Pseudoalteromonas sp. MM17-2]|uniref:hypothetical protein n=1 Tax=Pseudoalteromonas TaxID=53246 RepID=UPI0006B58549|nr:MULTISPECIES: hypothetical protein [Pseudoalteromonas]MCG7546223.1 hypothetical protein [Pseudoalteromonas sp. MM17-2]
MIMTKQIPLLVSALLLGACSSSVTIDDIVPAEEVKKPLFLRGDFSLWDAQPEYQMQRVAPAIYETKIRFSTPGKAYEFKIADAQWSAGYNCGYLDEGLDKTLELGLPVQADCNSVYNYFSFTPEEKGWYKVSINFSRFKKPLVTVNQVFE